jgi:CxxC motif-containing protein (DUF1111 family)
MKTLLISAFALLLLFACKKATQEQAVISEYEQEEELSAGVLTSYDLSELAFSYQVKNVTTDEKLNFFVGNSFFQDNWVEAPSSTTARDGLGPLFNAKSCAACHFKDGRGMPLAGKGLIFRLSIAENSEGNPIDDEIYGGQLQDFAISKIDMEGLMDIQYSEVSGKYPDGTTYSLRKPVYSIKSEKYGAISASIKISPRIGQQIIGMGLLELIQESDLLALSDPEDSNNDGISGKINYVWNPLSNSTEIGRFGWKANVATVAQQVAGAFNGDIGITTSFFKNENHSAHQTQCLGLPNGGEPEISDENLNHVILYTKSLAVPIRRDYKSSDVLTGKNLFNAIGCTSCHKPKFVTGHSGTMNALKGVTIRPYTDLLVHDMGEGLADNRPDFKANGNEWRTQPLWGLGMIKTVNKHSYLLHDGRARSIEEAILWHDGEAKNPRIKFMNLSSENRKKVIAFLESL